MRYIFNFYLTSSDSKVGPLIVKPPPPLPKPRKVPEPVPQEVPEPKPSRIPQVGRMKIVEPKPRRILSHKRALQAVTALAITVGLLLLAVIVSVVVILKRDTKGRPMYVKICLFLTAHISIFPDPRACFLLNTHKKLLTHKALYLLLYF